MRSLRSEVEAGNIKPYCEPILFSALNRGDTVQRVGGYPPPKGASPYLGLECSGIVEQVGKNVSRWKIGDQVTYLRFFVDRLSQL